MFNSLRCSQYETLIFFQNAEFSLRIRILLLLVLADLALAYTIFHYYLKP